MESNTWCPRLTAAMILSGSAVQEKGLGLSLVSATKRLMAAWSSTTHRKTPRFSRCLASFAKNPSTALSHEHEVGVKWKAKRGWRSSSSRHLRLSGIEEADEFLVTMALHTSANDVAFQYVECCEQRRCAMALVVMGHCAGSAPLHRQAGLGAVEGLDLRLFVDREDDGMGGRIDIKPDDITQFIDELRVFGELELPNSVRLETVRAPDALDGTCADAGCFRHQDRGPVGRLGGRLSLGEHHDTLSDVRSKGRDTRGARLVTQQAVVTLLHEAFLPAPDTGLRFARLAHDLVGADAGRAQQHDLGTPDMLMRRVAISRERSQTATISRLEDDGYSGSHAPDSHRSSPSRIPSGIQMSELIH